MTWSAPLDTSKLVSEAEKATAALGSMRSALDASFAAAARADAGMRAAAASAGSMADAAKKAGGNGAAAAAKGAGGAPDAAKRQKDAQDAAYMSTRKDAKAYGWGEKKEAYELAKRQREAGKKSGASALDMTRLTEKEDKAKKALNDENKAKGAALMSGSMKALGAAGVVASVGVAAATVAFKSFLSLASSATGVGSFDELTRIAIGAKALSQLQGIQARTNMGFRAMFRGIDTSPLVRAADLFSRNFTSQTVTGKAVGDIMSKGFSAAFAAIERLEPIATTVMTELMTGAYNVGTAWLELEIAALPFTKALDGALGSMTAMDIASVAVQAAFAKIADDIALVTKGIQLAADLAKEFGVIDPKVTKNKRGQGDAGADGAGDTKAAKGAGAEAATKGAGDAAAAGADVGAAMGAGMAAGLDASSSKVFDAGKRTSEAAVRGAKAGADIRSPSRKMRREVGWQLGEGVALGEEDKSDRVQRAADKSLVPDPPMIPALGGGGGGAGAFTGPLVSIGQIIVQGGDALATEVRRILDTEAARVAERLVIARVRA